MRYETEADRQNQRKVAAELMAAWPCLVTRRTEKGDWDSVDWDLWRRDGARGWHVKAVAELKCRTNEKAQYPTIFLSVRKYNALMAESKILKIPALFVVRYTDALCWIDVKDVDASNPEMKGRSDRGAVNDIEPIIDVPVWQLREINLARAAPVLQNAGLEKAKGVAA